MIYIRALLCFLSRPLTADLAMSLMETLNEPAKCGIGGAARQPTRDHLNRIQSATVYAQRSNLMSIPTDCP